MLPSIHVLHVVIEAAVCAVVLGEDQMALIVLQHLRHVSEATTRSDGDSPSADTLCRCGAEDAASSGRSSS